MISKLNIIKQVIKEEGLSLYQVENLSHPKGHKVCISWAGNPNPPDSCCTFIILDSESIISMIPKLYKSVKACHESRCDSLNAGMEYIKKA